MTHFSGYHWSPATQASQVLAGLPSISAMAQLACVQACLSYSTLTDSHSRQPMWDDCAHRQIDTEHASVGFAHAHPSNESTALFGFCSTQAANTGQRTCKLYLQWRFYCLEQLLQCPDPVLHVFFFVYLYIECSARGDYLKHVLFTSNSIWKKVDM